MAFFVKRFYSLKISETGRMFFDGKKEKNRWNPFRKRGRSFTEKSGKTPAATAGTGKNEKQGQKG